MDHCCARQEPMIPFFANAFCRSDCPMPASPQPIELRAIKDGTEDPIRYPVLWRLNPLEQFG
jgi:hypothetical protein